MRWVRAEAIDVAIVIPADGPSFGVAPSGTWIWIFQWSKMRANVSKKMLEYYKNQELVKYGIYLNEKRDYEGAYRAFKLHVDLPNLVMMSDPKLQKEMPRDTTYEQYKYYAAIFAVQSELHAEAIALLNEMKDAMP